MYESRFFSWKEQPPKLVQAGVEGEYEYASMIILPQEKFEIKFYEERIRYEYPNSVNVLLLFSPLAKKGRTFKIEERGHLRRGLVQDYLEIRIVMKQEIKPTLTINLCFNNRFYFGWLPILTLLAGCVSFFVWKKFRQGKKVDTPKLKYKH